MSKSASRNASAHRRSASSKYIEIVRPRRLVFTLSGEKRPQDMTRVSVEIVPLEEGCELTLVHESVLPDSANRTEGRWTGMLYGLATIIIPHPSGRSSLRPHPLNCCLKKSRVRDHASLAAASSYRGVVSLWKP